MKRSTPHSSALSNAGLFSKIVEDVREAALTTAEIAYITGVDERQVYNWASGASRPRGDKKDRLLEIHYIVKELRDVYTPEGTDIWLHARNRGLNGQKPIDLLISGDFRTVLAAVERLKTGAMYAHGSESRRRRRDVRYDRSLRCLSEARVAWYPNA